MNQGAQPIATLRKSNGRGQLRSQSKRNNNQPQKRSYEFPSDSSCLNTERWQQGENLCFPRKLINGFIHRSVFEKEVTSPRRRS